MKAAKPTQKKGSADELLEPRWSVISFDKCEASGLAYADAAKKLADLDAAKVTGLCIVTDEAAERMCGRKG